MNRINNEYDDFINRIAGTHNVDDIPHSTDSAGVAAAIAAHVSAVDAKRIADEQAAVDAVKAAAEKAAVDKAADEKSVTEAAAAIAAHVSAVEAKRIADEQTAAAAVDKAAAEKSVTEAAAAIAARASAADAKLIADEQTAAAAVKAVDAKSVTEAAAAIAARADAKLIADAQTAADVKAVDEKSVTEAAAAIAAYASAADTKHNADIQADAKAVDEKSVTEAAASIAAQSVTEAAAAQTAAAAIKAADDERIAAAANNTDAVIAAAASVAAARAIAPVSSPPDSQVPLTNAAGIAAAASTITEEVTDVAPQDTAESADCTTKLVAACKEYYKTARPDVTEIKRDSTYNDEPQAQSLCGKHALNNLFRRTWTCSTQDGGYTDDELTEIIANVNFHETYNEHLKAQHTVRPITLRKLCQLHRALEKHISNPTTSPNINDINAECTEGKPYDITEIENALHIAGYNTTQQTTGVPDNANDPSQLTNQNKLNNARKTAFISILKILENKPVGLILRTVTDRGSSHFIAVRKQLVNGNGGNDQYEAIDTLYQNAGEPTAFIQTHTITTADELETWLANAIYKHITNILIVNSFDGKYIPYAQYKPGDTTDNDESIIFTNVDGKIYVYKTAIKDKYILIDITDKICEYYKQVTEQEIIGDLHEFIQETREKLNNADNVDFDGHIPISYPDLTKIIAAATTTESAKTKISAEHPGANAERIAALSPTIPAVTPITDQQIKNGLLILISHILKHKNVAQPPSGQTSAASINVGAESAHTEISKPSIKFDNIKYNDAVEKFKTNINKEFAGANSIEISPVTIDVDAEGEYKYILFGSFTVENVKITRYNSHYDKPIEPKIPVSSNAAADSINPVVNQQDVDAEPASTTPISASSPQSQPNNSALIAAAAASTVTATATAATNNTATKDNYSAVIAAAVAAATAANASKANTSAPIDNYSASIAAAVAAIAVR